MRVAIMGVVQVKSAQEGGAASNRISALLGDTRELSLPLSLPGEHMAGGWLHQLSPESGCRKLFHSKAN